MSICVCCNICRAEKVLINTVKKIQLFERSEFWILRDLLVVFWEPDKVKLEALTRAFCYFFAEKKVHINLYM